MKVEDFQKEFEALLAKYSGICTIVAVPTNVMGKDGYWHPSAEIAVASVPKGGVPSPVSVIQTE